ncbi:hypothetical protein SAMN05443637_12553 [Pseudonocardia thermophila]|uniref:Tetratricopeptide repeat-containing protein n=1 Tax=Pseudonocardia thermophila TaxID=1848 RepID=A0A1M6ZXT6_PSETH|nr:hypothetical protein [Pseudonocardia thermophila]SHL35297.1 hypothetical protein SAMN05443637_12553 [Pseudonocardia thermophila]
MGGDDGALRTARAAYQQHRWDAAREGFRRAAAVTDLAPADALALADSAWWLGQVDESIEAGRAAHRAHLAAGERRGAAAAALQVAVNHLLRGEDIEGFGWMSRAAELLAELPDAPEAVYLRYFTRVEAAIDDCGDPEVAESVIAAARSVAADGRRLGDPGVVAAGTLGEGRALVKQGRVAEGLALLDKAMVTVVDGEIAPDIAGNLYCHMIAACHELGDVRRAAHWTAALERWRRAAGRRGVHRHLPGAPRADPRDGRGLGAGRASGGAGVRGAGRDHDQHRGRGALRAGRAAPAAGPVRRGRGGVRAGAPARPRSAAGAGVAAARPGQDVGGRGGGADGAARRDR